MENKPLSNRADYLEALSNAPNQPHPLGNTPTGTNYTGTTHTGTLHMYTIPELIDVIVTPSEVQLVYKRQLMMSTGFGMPNPEVYKVVYSRHDGSEKTIFGTYIPPSREGYEF